MEQNVKDDYQRLIKQNDIVNHSEDIERAQTKTAIKHEIYWKGGTIPLGIVRWYPLFSHLGCRNFFKIISTIISCL